MLNDEVVQYLKIKYKVPRRCQSFNIKCTNLLSFQNNEIKKRSKSLDNLCNNRLEHLLLDNKIRKTNFNASKLPRNKSNKINNENNMAKYTKNPLDISMYKDKYKTNDNLYTSFQKTKILSSDKFIYSISHYLDLESICNLRLSSKFVNNVLKDSKIVYESIKKEKKLTLSEIIYSKNYSWLTNNKNMVYEIHKEINIVYDEYFKFYSLIKSVFTYSFMILIPNINLYLVCLVIDKKIQKSQSLITALPLALLWCIILFILALAVYKKCNLNSTIQNIISIKLSENNILNSSYHGFLKKETKLKYKHLDTNIFLKYLFALNIFLIPLLVDNLFIRSSKFKIDDLFMLGSITFLSVFFLKDLIFFIKNKIIHFNDDKVEKYKNVITSIKEIKGFNEEKENLIKKLKDDMDSIEE